MIDMLVGILRALGLTNLEVCVNSLGSQGTRARYRDALRAYLEPKKADLSEHAQKRLDDNPLRILDSKNPKDQDAVKGAPSILDLLEPDDQAHWEGLKRALSALGTPFVVTPDLVRGLDYYTRTLFEIRSSDGALGSQNAVLGGGRYDGMVEELGGPRIPAVGFAMGLERVLLAMPERAAATPARCFIAPLGERALLEALVIARDLRQAGVAALADTRGGSLKSMLRRADSLGARLCLVLGDTELDRGVVAVKDLAEKQQTDVERSGLVAHVVAALARPAALPAGSA
jgi:histidyl-tRNA synthetase